MLTLIALLSSFTITMSCIALASLTLFSLIWRNSPRTAKSSSLREPITDAIASKPELNNRKSLKSLSRITYRTALLSKDQMYMLRVVLQVLLAETSTEEIILVLLALLQPQLEQRVTNMVMLLLIRDLFLIRSQLRTTHLHSV